jgi:hypothetical protein
MDVTQSAENAFRADFAAGVPRPERDEPEPLNSTAHSPDAHSGFPAQSIGAFPSPPPHLPGWNHPLTGVKVSLDALWGQQQAAGTHFLLSLRLSAPSGGQIL